MSGSGGFYKYRCKYFLTHNCPNWVFVNHAPCADCCAAGRDRVDVVLTGADAGHDARRARFDICAPFFLADGRLRYALAEVVAVDNDDVWVRRPLPPRAAAADKAFPIPSGGDDACEDGPALSSSFFASFFSS